MKRPVVGFAGLTHLGLVSAAAAAAKGFPVVAYGTDTAGVADIRAGNLPIAEPDLDDLFRDHAGRLTVTSDLAELGRCDLVYIATDVPTDDEQRSDLTGIEALIRRVIPVLAENAVLVVLCQVPPGFTRGVPVAPERLVYQVETLVFGRAVERALRPERFIVGLADPLLPVPAALATYLGSFGCPVLPMRYESAELAKIAINCCLAASVSIANTLAELSERVGADWAEVAPSLRLDRRIGPYSYLTPGLGLAGGNIERDLATVLDLAARHGAEASTIAGFVANSLHHQDWAWRAFHQAFPEGGRPRVAVLGLAYKENTHSTRNSAAVALIRRLEGLEVRAFDPVVPAATVPGVLRVESALAAAEGADVLFLMTPWPEFAQLVPAELAAVMKGRAVIDPYRLLNGAAVAAVGLDYHARGLPPLRGAGRS